MTEDRDRMRFLAQAAAHITAMVHVGIDLSLTPDRTAYWPRKPTAAPDPGKRAKVKAARKQRNRKP